MRRLLVAVAIATALLSPAPVTARPGPPFAFDYHAGWKNAHNPAYCYAEDDWDIWAGQGDLAAGQTVTFDVTFCNGWDPFPDAFWNGGNNSLYLEARSKSPIRLSDRCVANCRVDGAGGDGLAHDATLMFRQRGDDVWLGCENSYINPDTLHGGDPLGGTYRVTLTNSGARPAPVHLSIEHSASLPEAQRGRCPVADWNM